MLAATIVPIADAATAANPAGAAVALLFASALEVVVLSYAIVRSRWSGWRLVGAIFFVFFGVKVFQTLIEAVVFLQELADIIPPELTPILLAQGLITTALFSPLAVVTLGKMTRDDEIQPTNSRLVMPWTEWSWKLAVIAVIYVAVYLSFGALVFRSLVGDAVFQEYYGDLQLPAWFIPFQLLRGLIWVVLVLPVIRMMKGSRGEAGVAVALLLSVLISAQLFVPGDIMPDTIRLAHFVEVFSSQFVFGWIVVWLFHRHHENLKQLFV
ncbi:MAG: hypothetical protein ACTSYE_01100 [Alphaproteobacteria bacterium]